MAADADSAAGQDNHRPFAVVLYDIVCTGGSSIVGWSQSGRSFHIEDAKKFTTEILPRFFKHNRYASFQRQLNLYSFRKMVRGPEAGCYLHPFFQRDRPDLLGDVKRGICPALPQDLIRDVHGHHREHADAAAAAAARPASAAAAATAAAAAGKAEEKPTRIHGNGDGVRDDAEATTGFGSRERKSSGDATTSDAVAEDSRGNCAATAGGPAAPKTRRVTRVASAVAEAAAAAKPQPPRDRVRPEKRPLSPRPSSPPPARQNPNLARQSTDSAPQNPDPAPQDPNPARQNPNPARQNLKTGGAIHKLWGSTSALKRKRAAEDPEGGENLAVAPAAAAAAAAGAAMPAPPARLSAVAFGAAGMAGVEGASAAAAARVPAAARAAAAAARAAAAAAALPAAATVPAAAAIPVTAAAMAEAAAAGTSRRSVATVWCWDPAASTGNGLPDVPRLPAGWELARPRAAAAVSDAAAAKEAAAPNSGAKASATRRSNGAITVGERSVGVPSRVKAKGTVIWSSRIDGGGSSPRYNRKSGNSGRNSSVASSSGSAGALADWTARPNIAESPAARANGADYPAARVNDITRTGSGVFSAGPPHSARAAASGWPARSGGLNGPPVVLWRSSAEEDAAAGNGTFARHNGAAALAGDGAFAPRNSAAVQSDGAAAPLRSSAELAQWGIGGASASSRSGHGGVAANSSATDYAAAPASRCSDTVASMPSALAFARRLVPPTRRATIATSRPTGSSLPIAAPPAAAAAAQPTAAAAVPAAAAVAMPGAAAAEAGAVVAEARGATAAASAYRGAAYAATRAAAAGGVSASSAPALRGSDAHEDSYPRRGSINDVLSLLPGHRVSETRGDADLRRGSVNDVMSLLNLSKGELLEAAAAAACAAFCEDPEWVALSRSERRRSVEKAVSVWHAGQGAAAAAAAQYSAAAAAAAQYGVAEQFAAAAQFGAGNGSGFGAAAASAEAPGAAAAPAAAGCRDGLWPAAVAAAAASFPMRRNSGTPARRNSGAPAWRLSGVLSAGGGGGGGGGRSGGCGGFSRTCSFELAEAAFAKKRDSFTALTLEDRDALPGLCI